MGAACARACRSVNPCCVRVCICIPIEKVSIAACKPLAISPFSRIFVPEIYASILVVCRPKISRSKCGGIITIAPTLPLRTTCSHSGILSHSNSILISDVASIIEITLRDSCEWSISATTIGNLCGVPLSKITAKNSDVQSGNMVSVTRYGLNCHIRRSSRFTTQ